MCGCRTKKSGFPFLVILLVFGWVGVNRYLHSHNVVDEFVMSVQSPKSEEGAYHLAGQDVKAANGFIPVEEALDAEETSSAESQAADASSSEAADEVVAQEPVLAEAEAEAEVVVVAKAAEAQAEVIEESAGLDTSEPSTEEVVGEVTDETMLDNPLLEDLSNPLLPKDRPDWIARDTTTGEIHTLSFGTLPCDSQEACNDNLKAAAWQRFSGYAQQTLGISQQALNRIDGQWVVDKLVDKDANFLAARDVDNVTTYQLWSRITVGPEVRRQMQEWQKQLEWKQRSVRVALSMFTIMAACGILHVGLRARSGRTG